MFIINLTYKTSFDKVEPHLQAHMDFVNEQYENGNFLASGKKVPRTGGVILSGVESRETLSSLMEQDPFIQHGVADFEITEFVISRVSEHLKTTFSL
ncbi:GTP cyclohydrolase [Sinomicrobium pectinilyticum]|uniref:GTP cyclohydrolase n=1 Tax=Sinomicrobium pectinilyticum TaxID=1084421 RepID=A0A3N0EU78_SINP1|nr:YciI family protein [Sinomicrobium pectinilyticum]RNL91314.1 GTP cyclohydrolase [Sinomicrobium pectinilyticum]